jgi:hypothetical protein
MHLIQSWEERGTQEQVGFVPVPSDGLSGIPGPRVDVRVWVEKHSDELILRPLQKQLREGRVPKVNPNIQRWPSRRGAPHAWVRRTRSFI